MRNLKFKLNKIIESGFLTGFYLNKMTGFKYSKEMHPN